MKKLLRSVICILFSMLLIFCSSCGEDTGEGASSTDERNDVRKIFDQLQENDSMPFTMTEKAKSMLDTHPELFQADQSNPDQYLDSSLTYRQLSKNIDNYGDRLISIPNAYVVSAYETDLGEYCLSEFHLYDNDGNSYYVFSLVSYDIYDGDTVTCYGLPIASTSFENVSGGTTLAIVLVSSHLQKI